MWVLKWNICCSLSDSARLLNTWREKSLHTETTAFYIKTQRRINTKQLEEHIIEMKMSVYECLWDFLCLRAEHHIDCSALQNTVMVFRRERTNKYTFNSHWQAEPTYVIITGSDLINNWCLARTVRKTREKSPLHQRVQSHELTIKAFL